MNFYDNIGNLFFFSKKKQKETPNEDEEEPDNQNLLCRFVLDGSGRKVGESIAIDNDILILKSRDRYLGVPLKHIEEEEKTLLVKGLIDRFKAEQMGEKWRRDSFNKLESVGEEKNGL
jgi:hypothetical protein